MVLGGVLVVVAVLALMIAPNPAPADSDGDPFTGRWLVNGVDAQDVEYSGSLIISRATSGYELEWIVTGSVTSASTGAAHEFLGRAGAPEFHPGELASGPASQGSSTSA